MNQNPLCRDKRDGNGGFYRQSFLLQHCQHYNLSEMAIVFGIGAALAGLIITTIAVRIHLTLNPSPVVGYICVVVWFLFTLWLWISLVLIGKIDRQSRVSDAEFITLQILTSVNISAHALFASPEERVTWHTISLVFEWVIVGFHILYFLLALCIWVRLPWKVYAGFAVALAWVINQTMH